MSTPDPSRGIAYTFNPDEGICLFTDGSASTKDKSGGWAYVVLDAYDGMYKCAGYQGNTTISQMELRAPTLGLNWIHSHLGPCEVLVYSDSEYVVLGMRDKTRKRNKNKTHWNDLESAVRQHHYVQFEHVYGHSDNFFNELCDQMAGEARKKGVKS